MSMWRIMTTVVFIVCFSFCSKGEEKGKNEESKFKESVFLVNWDNPMQTIIASGINFEGYHTTGGSEVLSPKFETMLSMLPCQLNRMSLPLKIWEPENDNADPHEMDWSRFSDSDGVKYTFLRMQELKRRGMESWLSIWDMADWNVLNPQKSSQRKIADFDEMAESIAAFLIHAREKYGVEPLYVSVNEPTIAAENGWGGYNIALTPDEQIELIRKAGRLFEENSIKTKWLIALHKICPSEIKQAKEIYADAEVKKYAAGFDFHGYGMHTAEMETCLRAWKEWSSTTELPTFCGECDYDNRFWEKDERKYWGDAPKEYGRLIHNVLNLAGVNGFMPWYGNVPFEEYPYRYVSKHFMEAFLPETQLVETLSENSDILVTAGKRGNKYVLVIQNLSDEPVRVKVENQPSISWEWISSKNHLYFRKEEVVRTENGTLVLDLPANSIHNLTSI